MTRPAEVARCVNARAVALGLVLALVAVATVLEEVGALSVDPGGVVVAALIGSGLVLLLGSLRAVRGRPGPGCS